MGPRFRVLGEGCREGDGLSFDVMGVKAVLVLQDIHTQGPELPPESRALPGIPNQ